MTDAPALAPADRYTAPAIALHWCIALLIICGFSLGWVMTDIPDFPPEKIQYYAWHKWIGVTVFMLAVLRVLWRATHPAPPQLRQIACWQRCTAHFVHLLLYVMMLAIPLSGYLMSSASGKAVVYLGILPLPPLIEPNPTLASVMYTLHVYLNYFLLALVTLHVFAAFKHQFIDRDGVLARMLPFLKKR